MIWNLFWWRKKPIDPVKELMPTPLEIKKIPLKEDQYYQGVYPKKFIFLHHSAGGSAASSIAWWAKTPARIATPYIIDRDGSIYECFPPEFWCNHLGAGIKTLEQQSIGIEICSYGSLAVANKNHIPQPGKPQKYKKGDFITYTDKMMPPECVVQIGQFRPNINPFMNKPDANYDATYFEAYTPKQIAALKSLLPYLLDCFKITPQTDRKSFWEYSNPAALLPGIYSHTTVRKDKIDIFPQKELIDLVYSL